MPHTPLSPSVLDTLRVLQLLVHTAAVEKGWHEWPEHGGLPDLATMLLNIHGEVSEAWEEHRSGIGPTETWYSGGPEVGADGTVGGSPRKPEGIPSELADIVIRVFDTAAAFGIDLAAAIEEKMAFNATRPHRHGGKRA